MILNTLFSIFFAPISLKLAVEAIMLLDGKCEHIIRDIESDINLEMDNMINQAMEQKKEMDVNTKDLLLKTQNIYDEIKLIYDNY